MMGAGEKHHDLIADAGSILRVLAPPRVATLIFIREGDVSQLEIADRLNRTSGAISNYIETLTNLPHPLIEKDGHKMWLTSQGKQTVSAIYRFAGNVGIGLSPEWTAETSEELGRGLSPLHEFRSTPPFYVLHALGVGCPSGLAVDPDPDSVTTADIVATVREWIDESITRRQVRNRVKKFEQAGSLTIEDDTIALTEKGAEQCRLLEQIMQISADDSVIDDGSDISVAYQSDDGPALLLPARATPKELAELAARFGKEHGEIPLDLTPVD